MNKEQKTDAEIIALFSEQRRIEVQLALLDEQKQEIQQKLCSLISADTVRCGLRHVVTHNRSVAWKRVNDALVQKRLLKPAGAAILPSIVEECTSTSESHRVREAKKED